MRTSVILWMMSFLASGTLSAQYQWVKKYGITGKHEEITTTAFGGSDRIYVSGVYYNNTQLDGQDLAQDAVDTKGAFLAGLDMNGQVQWVNSYRATEGTDHPVIATAADGSLYLAVNYRGDITIGAFTLNSGNNSFGGGSILLAKFDASGTVQWAKSFEARKSEPRDITVAADGSILLAGVFHTSIDFGGGTVLSAWTGLTWESFVAKIDSTDGSLTWAIKTDSDKESGVCSIVTDDVGGIYIAGMYKDSLRFSPSTAFGFYEIPGSTTTNNNRRNAFYAKYDDSGNFVWAKQVKGENDARVLLTYADDHLYASLCNTPNNGYFFYDTDSVSYNGTKDFILKLDPVTGNKMTHGAIPGFIFSLTSDNTGSVFVSYGHITIAELDEAAQVVWSETRSAGGTTIASSKISARDGSVCMGGSIYGVSDIEFEPGLVLGPGETGYQDGWYAFFGAGSAPVSVSELPAAVACTVFPNPASGTVWLQLEQPEEGANVLLLDLSGKIFLREDFKAGKISLDLGGIPAGVYFVHIQNGGFIINRKLVVY